MFPVVVDASFLADHPDVVLLDVRWYLDGRDGRAAFEAGHVPGAQWVDLDRQLAAHGLPATEGRHPFPEPEAFADAMSSLGVGDDTVVVAYDDTGGLTAGRLVVMLRMLGRQAALLDGGLAAWTGDIETGPATARDTSAIRFTAQPWPSARLASADETFTTALNGGAVLDARSHERFTGEVTAVDPRPGHIPGARSAPWSGVLTSQGTLASVDHLRTYFADLGVTEETIDRGEVIASCGSGVSTCMNLLAMEHAGLPPAKLYVASFSGWSADPDRPVATGE